MQRNPQFYARLHASGMDGVIIDQSTAQFIGSLATGPSEFGRPALLADGASGFKMCDGSNAPLLGITVRRSIEPGAPERIEQGESSALLCKGLVWVRAGSAVEAGDPAAYDLATGAFVKAGTPGSAAIPGGVLATGGPSSVYVQLDLTVSVRPVARPYDEPPAP